MTERRDIPTTHVSGLAKLIAGDDSRVHGSLETSPTDLKVQLEEEVDCSWCRGYRSECEEL